MSEAARTSTVVQPSGTVGSGRSPTLQAGQRIVGVDAGGVDGEHGAKPSSALFNPAHGWPITSKDARSLAAGVSLLALALALNGARPATATPPPGWSSRCRTTPCWSTSAGWSARSHSTTPSSSAPPASASTSCWARLLVAGADTRHTHRRSPTTSAASTRCRTPPARGIKLQLTLAGPAPAWATEDRKVGNVRAPTPAKYGAFVRTVAAPLQGPLDRYSALERARI